MRVVKISGQLQYVECDLSQKESHLGVKLYLSSNFKRDPQTIHMDEKNLEKVYDLNVSGKVPRRMKTLKSNESIGAASFAITTNDFDAPVYIDVGTFHIPLQHIISDVHNNGRFEHIIPFEVHPAENFIKGKVRLIVTNIDMCGLKFDATSNLSTHMVDDNALQQMSAYINSTINMMQNIGDTVRGTENVQAPCEISESGLEYTKKVPLPFCAYALYETPQSNDGFWDNAYEVIMKRESYPSTALFKLDVANQAKVLVNMSCYVSQYLDYVSDTIDKNVRTKPYNSALKQAFENMGSASWSGDCEDTGKDIIMLFSSFMNHNIDGSKYKDEFERLKEIGNYYIPLMSLDVVHGAKVADQTEQIGAHLNTMFIPAHYFKSMLEKHPHGKELSAKAQWPDLSQYQELPVLVGEGTGKYDPLGSHDENSKDRRSIYKLSSMSPFKKDITHEIGEESSFYIGHLLGVTDYFFKQGIPIGGFLYGNIDKKATKGWTRGVYYTDLVNKKEKLALVPHPKVPPLVMNTINDVVTMRVPPNKLILDENAPVATRNEYLDSVVARYPVSGGKTTSLKQIPVYIRPHQINSKITERMISELANVHELKGVSYDLEQITNTIHGYRLVCYF